jgi:hypothetical protein
VVNLLTFRGLSLLFIISLISPVYAQNWQRVTELPLKDISSLLIRENTIHAGTDSVVYSSYDRGLTWTQSNVIPGSPMYIDAITEFDGKIFAGTGGNGIFTSSDSGQSWQQLNIGLSGSGSGYISGFAERDGLLYAATQGAGVFRLQGGAWSPFGNLTGSLAGNVEFLGLIGDTLVAGAGGNGYVWFAPPGSNDWTGVQIAPLQIAVFIIYSVVQFKHTLYAGSTYGIHRSTDKGMTWEYCGWGIPNGRRVRLTPSGDTLYATASSANTLWYKSTSVDDWEFIESTIYSYAETTAGGLFYAARGDGLWRSVIPTSIIQEPALPDKFKVEQNFPNPFNPSTAIRFSLAAQSHVTLEIYNALGQRVATLLDEFKETGLHSVLWSTDLPSGVYFYRIDIVPLISTEKRSSQVKRMIKLK